MLVENINPNLLSFTADKNCNSKSNQNNNNFQFINESIIHNNKRNNDNKNNNNLASKIKKSQVKIYANSKKGRILVYENGMGKVELKKNLQQFLSPEYNDTPISEILSYDDNGVISKIGNRGERRTSMELAMDTAVEILTKMRENKKTVQQSDSGISFEIVKQAVSFCLTIF